MTVSLMQFLSSIQTAENPTMENASKSLEVTSGGV
jgi:hypothetical protein